MRRSCARACAPRRSSARRRSASATARTLTASSTPRGRVGLIVDRMNDCLVVSCTSLGMPKHIDAVLDELEARLPPARDRRSARPWASAARRASPRGAATSAALLPDSETRIDVDGVLSAVPLEVGQKTGLFLDQRENVRRTAELAKGKTLLDACCYGGAFAIAALKAGAAKAEPLRHEREGLRARAAQLQLDGVQDRAEVRHADLYPELRRLKDQGARFDVVVLDPPKFASTQREVAKARTGYVNANAGALHLLGAGGLLVTCSCSHHVGEPLFEEIVREAAAKAQKDVQILERPARAPTTRRTSSAPRGAT